MAQFNEEKKKTKKFPKRFKRLTGYPLRSEYSKVERVESHMSPNERRKKIIERLSCRRYETIPQLAHEFGVSRSTIKRDLTILLTEYPIVSICGKGGGISLPEGYYISEKHLSPMQADAIRKCLLTANSEIRPILESILIDFAW